MPYTHNLDPIAFKIGFFVMPWYWLVYFLGYFWVFYCMEHFYKKSLVDLPRELIYKFMTRGFLCMLLGGRLTYIFLYNLPYFLKEPEKVFHIWEGGMSFHGGLVGIVLCTIYYSKKYQKTIFDFTDAVSTSGPLVLGFGRIANFINGELAGRPTDSVVGVIFPKYFDQVPRHASQLYEAFFEGFLIFTILWWKKSNLSVSGMQSSLFLILYGLFRFFIEYFRMPDRQLGFIFFNLTMGQILCLIMIVIGGFLYPRNKSTSLPSHS